MSELASEQSVTGRPMVPNSTYRLQLNPAFDLAAAVGVVDYLKRLGIGAVYTSPLLAAAPGSTHGYDVVDPTRANPELGGEQGRRRLAAAVRTAGLGLVVDVVPNHMSVEVPSANPWWWDVLKYGARSQYARYFDIDFSREPVLLPVLGDDEPAALAHLEVRDGRLIYYDHEFPLAPDTEQGSPIEIHQRQHYRLVSWRRGNTELGYRRFFDVTTLVGARVEEAAVFAATHAELLRWVNSGDVDGLRIDHPDGLTDPGGYLRRLRESLGENADSWLVVEKILGVGEWLPVSWPVHGTTGYDALREICGVFVDPAGEHPINEMAETFGLCTNFAEVEEECRRLIATTSLMAEMRRIAALVPGMPENTEDTVRQAVAELMIAFPVYRSYLPEGLYYWSTAVNRVRSARPDLAGAVDALDREVRTYPEGELARRIQQTSGMVVAKGTEDTAFYRYTRFVALNEVGGAPDRFGVSVTEFHAAAMARESAWPAGMTALSTHDTKRAEDVRARLAVLAEMPDEFADAVYRWSSWRGLPEPSLNLLAWQTLVGAWPITAERLSAYLDKAAKEAKLRTSWVDHDEEFESTVRNWPAEVFGDEELNRDIADFAARITLPGWSNSLGQKLIHLAGPGVPDVYQGTELFDLSLVDPDNRRPVNFAERTRLLDRLDQGWLPEVDDSGAAKLHLVRQILRLRRERPTLFTGYRPLHAEGAAAEHALAFARGVRFEMVAVATRLPVGLHRSGGWSNTVLPLPAGPGTWTDLLTGRAVETRHETPMAALTDLFVRYPVALLVRGTP